MEERGKKAKHSPAGSWYKMPREITLSSELNPYQFRVLAILLDRGNLYQSTKGKTSFSCYIGWIVSHSGMGETKAKKTLNELETMGFINIIRNKDTRRANQFHINWDFINAYKRPLTQQELDGMEDPDTQEEELKAQIEGPEIQEKTAPVASPTIEDLDVDLEATLEDRRQRYPEPLAQTPPGSVVQTSTLPSAAEWYQSVGKETLYGTDFPYLYRLTLDQKNEQVFENYVAEMMNRVLPQVKEKDAWSVWKNIVSPGFSEYMKEQKQQNEQSV